MLRITAYDSSAEKSLVVEGKLAGACVAELEKCWRAALSDHSARSILVDLSSVTFIDACGKQLLTGIYRMGTRFVAAGLIAKSVIEEIESTEDQNDDSRVD